MTLSSAFYARNTTAVAKALLGKLLIHDSPHGRTAGIIVETEAYLQDDPASHSYSGKSKRNAAMFGKPGTAYVYTSYGVHRCFNVVTNKAGIGEAVLIRALEPVEGISLMQRRRRTKDVHALCSGPGKLVEAMGITLQDNGCTLDGKLRIVPGRRKKQKIIACKRVGISKNVHAYLRYIIKDAAFCSRP
ncbi:MAG: DNA-3-methyladenine glycosylase [archaeon]